MVAAVQDVNSVQGPGKACQPITVRQGAFEFADDTPAHWIPGEVEFAQMVNGASFVMPHLEPFLVSTLGEAARLIADPAIKREAREFCLQETQHYRTHRRFNDRILAQGYTDLEAIEAEMARAYARLGKLPLGKRLAYSAGFEAMTMGLTRWLVSRRLQLFAGADRSVTSFILWHMVEETEHKLVAHDVYCAVTPGFWRRAFGVIHGSLDVIRWSRRCYIALLKQDGKWHSLRSRLKVWRWAVRFIAGAGPTLLKALLPGHDPRGERNHPWVDQWIAGYARLDPARQTRAMPLIDTASPTMPVPF